MDPIISKHFDILIEGGTALTMTVNQEILEDAVIGIRDGRIALITQKDDPDCPSFQAQNTIHADGCLVMPGLVNTHTHLPMVCFRGMADDLPLMEWLTRHIFPAEAAFVNKRMVYDGTLLAIAEMILSGTTTFCDGYFFENQVAEAAQTAGMRAVVCQGFADFAAPDHANFEKMMAAADRFVCRWKPHTPMITPAFFCHSPYTCSPETLVNVKKAAREAGILYLTHLLENREENNIIKERYGSTPVRHLLDLGVLDDRTIAVHCNWLSDEDMAVFADQGVGVSHNPRSSMKLGAGVAPVPRMIASNNNLDMITEMDLCAKVHKVVSLKPTVMDARSIVWMATIGGARLLGFDAQTGSLETGKQADMILVDMNQPHLTPLYNPYSQLVYAACGADVKTSIIAGRIVMRDRQLLTVDIEEAMARVRQIAQKIKNAGSPPA